MQEVGVFSVSFPYGLIMQRFGTLLGKFKYGTY